jgi:hypothetical protein
VRTAAKIAANSGGLRPVAHVMWDRRQRWCALESAEGGTCLCGRVRRFHFREIETSPRPRGDARECRAKRRPLDRTAPWEAKTGVVSNTTRSQCPFTRTHSACLPQRVTSPLPQFPPAA